MPERTQPVDGFVSSPLARVHDWAVWSLVRGEFTDPDGERFVRSFVVSPGAVGAVAVDDTPAHKVVLVRQYRPALHRMTLEIPAGMRDVDGEDPRITAERELREETGYEAREWTRLGKHVSAPGIADSQVEVFLARGLRAVAVDRHGPEERHMTLEWIPFSDALAMVVDGRIDDAKTVIGLLLTERHLRRG